MAIEYKVAADKKQEDNDVWDQEMQSKTNVYKTIIEALEYQMGKLRQGSTEKKGLEDESKGTASKQNYLNSLSQSSMELISIGWDSET